MARYSNRKSSINPNVNGSLIVDLLELSNSGDYPYDPEYEIIEGDTMRYAYSKECSAGEV